MSRNNQGKLFPQVPEELRSEYASQRCPHCLGLTGDLAPTYYIPCVCHLTNTRVYSHSCEHNGSLLGSNRPVRPVPYLPIKWCYDPRTEDIYNPKRSKPDTDYVPLNIDARGKRSKFASPKPSELPAHDPSRPAWKCSKWELQYLDDLGSETSKIICRLVAKGFRRTRRLHEYVQDFLVDYVPGCGDTSRKFVRDIAVLRITHDYPRNTVVLQGDVPKSEDDPLIKFKTIGEGYEKPRSRQIEGCNEGHNISPESDPDWQLDITLFTNEQLEIIAACEQQQISEPENGWSEHLTSQRCHQLVEEGFSLRAVARRLGKSRERVKQLYEEVLKVIHNSDLVLPSVKVTEPSRIVNPTESEREALNIEPMEHDRDGSHLERVKHYCCHTESERKAFDEHQETGVFRQLLKPVAERCREFLQQSTGPDESQVLAVA